MRIIRPFVVAISMVENPNIKPILSMCNPDGQLVFTHAFTVHQINDDSVIYKMKTSIDDTGISTKDDSSSYIILDFHDVDGIIDNTEFTINKIMCGIYQLNWVDTQLKFDYMMI